MERSLVYTVGYYLPAAAFGKVFTGMSEAAGWAAANAALFAWALAGVWHLIVHALRNGCLQSRLATVAVKTVMAAAIVIGAATPFFEMQRSLTRYNIRPPSIETITDLKPGIFPQVKQYLGHRQSFFFRYLAPQAEASAARPATPLD